MERLPTPIDEPKQSPPESAKSTDSKPEKGGIVTTH